MASIRALITCSAVVGALALVSGCILIADLDRFHGPSDGGVASSTSKSTAASDLIVMLDRQATDVALDVVDAENAVLSRVIVTGGSASELVVPNALPSDGSAPYAIELYDLEPRRFVGRLDVGEAARDGDRYRADFRGWRGDTTTAPRGREVGASATIHVRGLATHAANTVIEARVLTKDRVVGLYRTRAHSDAIDLVLPGCVNVDEAHEIVLFIDANGDGVVDERGLVTTPIRSSSGIEGMFDVHSNETAR